MEQDLISKKELLELTGISYGQLYRWKRKNLIPEEWFIRRSAFTGQETFFPRTKILPRIEKILGMKEDLSLDDLADVFSPAPSALRLEKAEVLERNIVSSSVLELLTGAYPAIEILSFEMLLAAFIVDKWLKSGHIVRGEGLSILQAFTECYQSLAAKSGEILFLRKLGVGVCLVTDGGELYFDRETHIVARCSIASCVEELKILIG